MGEALLALIDTHAHLQMKTFKKDINTVIERALASGISAIINVGYDLPSSEAAVGLALKYPFMYAAVGIHPNDADGYNEESLLVLEGFVREDKVVAIGEIGLDYKWNKVDKNTQKRVFTEQLDFAKDKNIPVIIHTRYAYSDVFNVLTKHSPSKILLHCFSGNISDLKESINRGYTIAFGGTITYSEDYAELIQVAPIDRIVLETDAPFLAPVPYRGKRNEPSYITFTTEKFASIKGVSFNRIAEATTTNAQKFFNLPER